MTGFIIACLILGFLVVCAVWCVTDIYAQCELAQLEADLDWLWADDDGIDFDEVADDVDFGRLLA